MTDEQINIAIAKAHGLSEPFGWRWLPEAAPSGGDEWAFCGVRDGHDEKVSDCANDLNAMHEVEKVLVSWDDPQNAGHCIWKDSYDAYIGWLAKLTGSLYFHPKADSSEFRKLISASAAQRAEAFLRTLGSWEES